MINNNEIRVFTNTHRVNEAEVGTEFKLTVTIPKDIKVNNLKVLFNMEGENPSVVKEMTKANLRAVRKRTRHYQV